MVMLLCLPALESKRKIQGSPLLHGIMADGDSKSPLTVLARAVVLASLGSFRDAGPGAGRFLVVFIVTSPASFLIVLRGAFPQLGGWAPTLGGLHSRRLLSPGTHCLR